MAKKTSAKPSSGAAVASKHHAVDDPKSPPPSWGAPCGLTVETAPVETPSPVAGVEPSLPLGIAVPAATATITRWEESLLRAQEPIFSDQIPLIKSEAPGYMPLSSAALWIATKGGAEHFDLNDTTIWNKAYAGLFAHISSREMALTAIYKGKRDEVPAPLVATIRVRHIFSDDDDDFRNGDLYIREGVYLDEDHRNHVNEDKNPGLFLDNLEKWNCKRGRRVVKYRDLQVLKSDVRGWWPFDVGQQVQPSDETPRPAQVSGDVYREETTTTLAPITGAIEPQVQSAVEYVEDYISRMKAQKRYPSQDGLWEEAIHLGFKREALRKLLSERCQPEMGRPKKSPK